MGEEFQLARDPPGRHYWIPRSIEGHQTFTPYAASQCPPRRRSRGLETSWTSIELSHAIHYRCPSRLKRKGKLTAQRGLLQQYQVALPLLCYTTTYRDRSHICGGF